MPRGQYIEQMRWPELAESFRLKRPILMPIGAAAKEHGYHLPMNTDFILAKKLSEGIAEQLPFLIAPIISFGYYPAFCGYPGSQHLRAETFIALLTDLIESYLNQDCGPLVLLNTGYSTEGPIGLVLADIAQRRKVPITCADIRNLGRKAKTILEQKWGSHADEAETSLLLFLAPQSVHMDLAKPDYGAEGMPSSLRQFSALDTETGVYGDPTLASAEKGAILFKAMMEDLVDSLRPFCPSS